MVEGPNWVQVASRVVAVLLVALAGTLYAAGGVLESATARDEAIPLLERMLDDPYRTAFQDAAAAGDTVIEVDDDLVQIAPITVEAVRAEGFGAVVDRLVAARALELYEGRIPDDPGLSRTHVGLPRSFVEQLSAPQHERAAVARLAATVALGASLLVLAAIAATSLASIMSSVGAGLFAAYLSIRWHLWLLDLTLDRTHPDASAYQGVLSRLAEDAPRPFFLAGVALLFAGAVLRRLLPAVVTDGDPAPDPDVAAPVPPVPTGPVATTAPPAATAATTAPRSRGGGRADPLASPAGDDRGPVRVVRRRGDAQAPDAPAQHPTAAPTSSPRPSVARPAARASARETARPRGAAPASASDAPEARGASAAGRRRAAARPANRPTSVRVARPGPDAAVDRARQGTAGPASVATEPVGATAAGAGATDATDATIATVAGAADGAAPAVAPAPAREGFDDDERWTLRRAAEVVAVVVGSLLIASLVSRFVAQPYLIPSESMTPTLQVGDRIIVEKLSLRLRDPQRGDIVVFEPPPESGIPVERLIKRVLGLPGETIELRDGLLVVDGEQLNERYLEDAFGSYGPVTVPDGHVVVFGDNRDDSQDSRSFGPVPLELVEGRALLRFWPVTSLGGI